MIKGKSQSEQFYSRSGNHSTKGSRKGYSLLGGGEDVVAQLTPEQRKNNLVTRLKYLRTLKAITGLSPEELHEKHILDKKVRKLEKEIKAKSPVQLPDMFMDVCREIMTPDQFAHFFDLAKSRRDRVSQKGED